MLALAYQKGIGVATNADKAAEWFRRAEEKGVVSSDALFAMGNNFFGGLGGQERDPLKAFQLWRAAADKGHGTAAYNMAHFYYRGLAAIGLPEDYHQSYRWSLRAVQYGESDGAYFAGLCCEMGHGAVADHLLAIQWYMHCLQGNGEDHLKIRCMIGLGRCYYKGGSHDGVQMDAKGRHGGLPPDYTKAAYWWRRAIDAGPAPEAYNLLGDLHAAGHGVPRSLEKAAELWAKAAEQGKGENVSPEGRTAGEAAAEGLRMMKGRPGRERIEMAAAALALAALLLAVVAYFTIKYREMAAETWFSKQTASPDP